nr:LamG domain-containing protein [Chthoniobacterales bacterium]
GLVEVYHLPGACVEPPANLVGWWTGDGNGVDISGGNDATLMGGATFGAGKVSEAFSLDGVDDFVVAAQTPATDSEITLDAWIFPTTLSNSAIGPVIFEKGTTLNSRIGLQVTADGQLCGYLSSDTFNVCSAAQTIPATQFTHVAITFSNISQEMRLYANGALVAQTTGTDTLLTGTEQFVIGDSQTSGLADNFAGLVDEVEMFDRTLTVEEIKAIYNAGAFGKCKPQAQPGKR